MHDHHFTWSLPLEETGPRFLDDWSSSYAFSSRLGGSLRCGVLGAPHPTVEWVTRNGLPVENVTGLREILPAGNIRFFPFSPEKYRSDLHSTGYRCKAKNPSGIIISSEIVVRAVLDTPFHIENPDVFIIRGNNAILRCIVPPELTDFVSVTSWVQDSSLNIYPNFQTGKWLMLPSGELHVFNVDVTDGKKTWACRTLHKLTNVVTTSKGAKIVVKEPEGPQIVRMLGERERHLRVRAGEETYLSISAEGNPPPSFSWYREVDGVVSELIPSKKPLSSQNVIHLSQVRPENSGTYLCRGNNSHSADQTTLILTVYVPLRVQVSPSSQVVDVGRGASVRCLVSGSPIHHLVWYKDGVELNIESENSASQPRYSSTESRETLTLPRVHPESAGMYQCLVSNDLTTAQDSAQIRLGSVLPELIYRFSEQTIQEGPSVSLKCTAVGNPPPQFSWSLDGFPLPENERYLVGQYVTIHDNVISHVNITNARSEDGGLYECAGRNIMGQIVHRARLNIYGVPFVRPVPPIKGVAGRSLQIQCPVSGYPIESITWEKSGSPLPVTRMQRVYPNGTLILEHIQKGDEGILTCTAKGRGKEISSRDLQLRVVVPPKIMPFQFMNAVLREGMRAAVSCQLLEGDRPIDLIWEFNGNTITAATSNGVTIRVPDEYSSTLVIDSLSSANNGKYTCIAENSAGREYFSSELTVQIPPKWTLEPRDIINVSAGHSLFLHCQADGHPTPSVTWKKAIGTLPGEYKDISVTSNSNTFPNGTLRLDHVRKSDENSYLCETKNGVGSGLSKVIFLKVNAPAQFSSRGEDAQISSVRVGEKAVLKCKAEGDLPIQLEWTNKHGKIGLHSNHRYTLRDQELESGLLSELIIASVDRSDSGAYSCRSSNAYGFDHTTVTLNVQEPPEQPINLRVVEVGSRTVGISWLENFNGNSPLINFIIQSKFPSETWTEAEVEELAVPASQSTALVEGLTPSSTYHLRVLAQNGVGFSPPSEVVQITTTEEAPEGPPLEVTVGAESSIRLRIVWAPPERAHWHGQILGYYLGFRELSLALADHPVLSLPGGGESTTTAMLGHGHSHSHSSNLGDLHGYHFKTVEVGTNFGGETIIDNLKKFSRYAIVVQAFNAKGAGPSSVPTVATTLQDVPSLPPDKVECRSTSPQSLALSWEPPPLEGRHGVVQGYKVEILELSPEDGDPTIQTDTKTTPERELILHGLRKWTNYSLTVKAFTAVGEGAVSTPIICRTDEDVPSPPSELKAVTSSRRSIFLSWLPPLSPNGKVVKYTVYGRLIDGNKVEKKIVPFSETTLEWGKLQEGEKYEFWVSATTRVGEGTPTPRSKAMTSSNNKVGARIASFGGLIEIPWKREFVLDCIAVGVPEPGVHWSFNGVRLHSGGKREVQLASGGNNKLVVKEVGVDDGGVYSCSASNAYGNDSLDYTVKIQTPPQAPIIQVMDVGHTLLRVAWSSPHSGGSPVRGYLISYRREGGDWEETEVGPRGTGHTLQPLLCGSTYQLYITASNKIGSGPASDILTRSTKGHAPISPKKDEALISNHSTIVVRLDLWKDSGCPILRYMIEYKQSQEKPWMRIPAELNGSAKSYTLTGLHPNTRYDIRVTAGNHAGDTLAKYEFLTGSLPHLPTLGSAVNHPEGSEAAAAPQSTSLLVVFPSLLSLATVTAVISFLCYVRRKRIVGIPAPKTVIGDGSVPGVDLYHEGYSGHQNQNHGSSGGHHGRGMHDGPPHPQQPQHYTLVKGAQGQYPDLMAPYAKARDSTSEYGDDVCPYATFQLPENPPTRPLLTKGGGFHTGDTLYNVGNVYSGPYHAVQSQNFMATLPIRDAEYMKLGRKVGGGLEEEDAEVKKILSMHLPLSEYDTLGSEDSSPKYHHPHHTHHPNVNPQLMDRQGLLLQHQQLATFRQRNRSDPIMTSEQSSSSTDESSPTGGGGRSKSGGYSSQHKPHKSSNSGQPRVRSSSGYSSHTEETSFANTPFGGQVNQQQSRYSERSMVGGDIDDGLVEQLPDQTKYSMKRNKQRFHKNKGTYHIDV